MYSFQRDELVLAKKINLIAFCQASLSSASLSMPLGTDLPCGTKPLSWASLQIENWTVTGKITATSTKPIHMEEQ